jgi:hypothetical protein
MKAKKAVSVSVSVSVNASGKGRVWETIQQHSTKKH